MCIRFFPQSALTLVAVSAIAMAMVGRPVATRKMEEPSINSMGNMKMGPMPAHIQPAGRLVSSQVAMRIIASADRDGKVVRHGRRKILMFKGKVAKISFIAVQPGFPDQTFELHKLVDPTITVHAGARVKVLLLNMDYGPGMYHGLVIGKAAPPYHMMVAVPVKHQLMLMPLIAPRSAKSIRRSKYFVERTSFTAPNAPGVYYYLCQMPMHAKVGMYGKFIVRK